jgi:hypothetical protein
MKGLGEGMREKLVMRMIVIVLMAIFAMTALSPISSAYDSSRISVSTASELSNVTPDGILKLNLADLSEKAAHGERICLKILGSDTSFCLVPTQLSIDQAAFSVASAEDMAVKEKLMNTKTYRGTDCIGVQSLVATLSPDWIQISLTKDGKEYTIYPVDGTGQSGDYAIYSAEDIQSSPIDLSADVLTPPTDAVNLLGQAWANSSSTGIAIPSIEVAEAAAPSDLVPAVALGSSESKTNKTCSGSGSDDPDYTLVRILLACDVDFRNRYPGDWASRMLSRMADIDARWESQVTISFDVAQIYAVPAGVCPSTNAATLLDQFRTHIMTADATRNTPREVSHLFTGKDLDGDTIGTSWEPGSSKWLGTDWSYSLSEQFHDSFENTWIMGHELGHNFNGDHAYWSWIGGCMSWMCPTYSWPMTAQFSIKNTNRISTWGQQVVDHHVCLNYGPSSTSGDNLRSANLIQDGPAVVFLVGNTMTVSYDITNVGGAGITLNSLFVGARDAAGTNKDFGHIFNVIIGAGVTQHFEATYTPQSGGTWTLWPAYNYQGHYGPYQWLNIYPVTYFQKALWQGKDTTTSTDDVDLFYRFYVLTTVQIPVVGSTVIVWFTEFNGKTGTGDTTYQYFFVGCRDSTGTNKDFGSSGQKTVTQVASGATGGGCNIFASRSLDRSGTWTFWPAYKISDLYGPYMWHSLTLTV